MNTKVYKHGYSSYEEWRLLANQIHSSPFERNANFTIFDSIHYILFSGGILLAYTYVIRVYRD